MTSTRTGARSPGDMNRRADTARGRGRKGLTATLAVMVSAVLLVASPALAAAPEVVEQFSYDDTHEVPAGEFPCGVAVTRHDIGTTRITEYSDNDGNVVRVTAHIGGITTITSEYGQVVNRWHQYGTFDPETNTVTWSGNSFNLHGDAGGILANVSGRWVEDFLTGELITVVGGPHEDPEADPEVFATVCTALTP